MSEIKRTNTQPAAFEAVGRIDVLALRAEAERRRAAVIRSAFVRANVSLRQHLVALLGPVLGWHRHQLPRHFDHPRAPHAT
jgi:hypothetical protein